MHGVERGKRWRLYQNLTYRYSFAWTTAFLKECWLIRKVYYSKTKNESLEFKRLDGASFLWR